MQVLNRSLKCDAFFTGNSLAKSIIGLIVLAVTTNTFSLQPLDDPRYSINGNQPILASSPANKKSRLQNLSAQVIASNLRPEDRQTFFELWLSKNFQRIFYDTLNTMLSENAIADARSTKDVEKWLVFYNDLIWLWETNNPALSQLFYTRTFDVEAPLGQIKLEVNYGKGTADSIFYVNQLGNVEGLDVLMSDVKLGSNRGSTGAGDVEVTRLYVTPTRVNVTVR